MEGKNHIILSSFLWKFSERIIAQFVSLIVSIILARLLSPDNYGVVGIVMVFINIADVFVVSGLSASLVQKKDADSVDFSTIFYCSFVFSIIIYIILFAISPSVASFYNEQSLTNVLRVFSIKIIISSFNSIQHAYVQRKMIFKKFFFSTIIGTLISGIIGIVMSYHNFGVWAIVSQYLANAVIDTVVLFFIVPWRPSLEFSFRSAHELISFGWKVLMTDLISQIFNNIRSFFIGKIYTPADLAYYNKGQQIPNLIGNNVDSSISSVLFPVMSNHSDDKEKIKDITQKSLKITSYIIFPLLAGLAAISKPLVNILLTSKWEQSVIYIQLSCVAQALLTVTNINLQAIKAIGRSDVLLKLELIKKPIALLIIAIGLYNGMLAVAFSLPIYNFIGALINVKPSFILFGYSLKEQVSDLFPASFVSVAMFFLVKQLGLLIYNDYYLIAVQIISGVFFYYGVSKMFKIEAYLYLKEKMKDELQKRVNKFN